MTVKHMTLYETEDSIEHAEALDGLRLTLIAFPDHVIDDPLLRTNKKIVGVKRASEHSAVLQAPEPLIEGVTRAEVVRKPAIESQNDDVAIMEEVNEPAWQAQDDAEAASELRSSPVSSSAASGEHSLAESQSTAGSSYSVSPTSRTGERISDDHEKENLASQAQGVDVQCIIAFDKGTCCRMDDKLRLYIDQDGVMRMTQSGKVIFAITLNSVARIFCGSDVSALLELTRMARPHSSSPA